MGPVIVRWSARSPWLVPRSVAATGVHFSPDGRFVVAAEEGGSLLGHSLEGRPLFALDRLWVRPRGALARLACHDAGEARAASDHLPLRAELALDPAAASAA